MRFRHLTLSAALFLTSAACTSDDTDVGADAGPNDGGQNDGGQNDGNDRAADAGDLVSGVLDAAAERSADLASDAHTDVSPDSPNDSVRGDGGPTPDGASTVAVWPADATKMVAEDRGGGFGPLPPAGSTCQPGGTYTMAVADATLTWRLCRSSNFTQPYQIVMGERVLTNNERDGLVAALNKVAVSTQAVCGADKQVLALKVSTPAGEREYLDHFYACQNKGVYVSQIDGVFQALRALVP